MPKLIAKDNINTDLNINEEYYMPCFKCSNWTSWNGSDSSSSELRHIDSLIEGKLFGKNISMTLCYKHRDELVRFLVATANRVDFEAYYLKFVKDK